MTSDTHTPSSHVLTHIIHTITISNRAYLLHLGGALIDGLLFVHRTCLRLRRQVLRVITQLQRRIRGAGGTCVWYVWNERCVRDCAAFVTALNVLLCVCVCVSCVACLCLCRVYVSVFVSVSICLSLCVCRGSCVMCVMCLCVCVCLCSVSVYVRCPVRSPLAL